LDNRKQKIDIYIYRTIGEGTAGFERTAGFMARLDLEALATRSHPDPAPGRLLEKSAKRKGG
jgi:hypothetical protein